MSDFYIGLVIGVAWTIYSICCGLSFVYLPHPSPKNKADIYIAPLFFPAISLLLSPIIVFLVVESFFKWVARP